MSILRIVITECAFHLAHSMHCELINKLFQYQNIHSCTIMYLSLNCLIRTEVHNSGNVHLLVLNEFVTEGACLLPTEQLDYILFQ